jgi:hypothetical protein
MYVCMSCGHRVPASHSCSKGRRKWAQASGGDLRWLWLMAFIWLGTALWIWIR